MPDPIVTVTLNPAIDYVFDVPNLTLGAHQKGRCQYRMPAGKGVNVARTLRQLGQPAVATGLLGQDAKQLFAETLSRDGIVSDFVPVEGATRQNITLVDSQRRTETHIRDVGFEARPDDVEALQHRLAKHLSAERIVVFSGSLPPGLRAVDLVELIRMCTAAGCRVVVDADGAVLARLAGAPLWSAKPNRTEFGEWVGEVVDSDADLLTRGRALQADVAELLVSCGARGAYLFTAEGPLRGVLTGRLPRVVSTVSCGDCFLGGYLAARVAERPPADALRQALATGTAAATSAVPGQFDADLAADLLEQTEVRPAG